MTGRPSWGIDALLVLMVVIWGANYSVIKRCFAEIAPQPFNALRLVDRVRDVLSRDPRSRDRRARVRPARLSSRVLHAGAAHDARSRRSPVARPGRPSRVSDSVSSAASARRASRTPRSSSASTPVAIATPSALIGHERIAPLHWIGAVVALVGIYFVVGHGASFGGAALDRATRS